MQKITFKEWDGLEPTEQDVPISASNLNTMQNNIETSINEDTGRRLNVVLNNSDYTIKIQLYDANNNLINESNTIDLPIEQLVTQMTYDSNTKEMVITLQNGNTTRVPLSSLISGLVNSSDLTQTLLNYALKTDIVNFIEFQESEDV